MSVALNIVPEVREIKHVHFFCGAGAGAKGVNRAKAEVGMLKGRFRCLGGVDNDPAAIRDFTRATGVRGTVLDLFTREQYTAFHGHEPPAGWRAATVEDIRRAAGYEYPDVILMSAPCKGFSGLLSEARSTSAKYQALNQLALRGLELACQAWFDDPPSFILFENVPRIATRGRELVDEIIAILTRYGYACAETVHDCGELNGWHATRRRFLLVARHEQKVPPYLYEPQKRPLQPVGKLLEQLPVPGDVVVAGPMHRVPRLHWRTWVRLAFVEAGKDWRSLQRLEVENGYLKDYAILPDSRWRPGVLGVTAWDEPVTTVCGENRPTNGKFSVADPRTGYGNSTYNNVLRVTPWHETAGAVTGAGRVYGGALSVADPRIEQSGEYGQLGVRPWNQPAGAVTGQSAVGGGPFAVADPRLEAVKHNNCFRVVRWKDAGCSVTGGTGPSAGGVAVADPRLAYNDGAHTSKFRVTPWEEPGKTVTGVDQVQGGALAVADPRCGMKRAPGDPYEDAGHYGVVRWDDPAGVVTAALSHDNGYGSVADPRLPAPDDKLIAIIQSEDGTWHRPFTTYELAALQGYVDPGDRLEMDGTSDSAHRERIGNMIPVGAAEAIFGVIGTAFLLAQAGETFVLGATPIWVRDVAIAIAVARRMPTEGRLQ